MSTVTAQSVTFVQRYVGSLTFDATIKEGHESILTITDAPVEAGAPLSDNAYLEPKKLMMQVAVSDNPLYALDTSDPYAAGVSRSASAWQALLDVQATLDTINVQTGLMFYQNMMISRIRAEQDKDTCQILYAELELREVNIVYTQTVTYTPRAKGATTRQAAATNTKGDQQGTKEEPPQQKGSIIEHILGNV